MSAKITGTEPTVAVSDTAPNPGGPTRSSALEEPRSGDPSATSARHVFAGRYTIVGLVGSGGMGTVYRAHDMELDEPVALKMLRRDVVDQPGMLDRFRQEVKLARRVTHKNVARTFDIGERDGEKFLTMEFVEGESLAARIAREGALTLDVVVGIASAICAGLEAAHAAGVVHRDLKPDNVLLGRDGRVVITDFGIARALVDAGRAATVGLTLGTPSYMAPEQVEGASDLDARADIYALGAMLFECLTGEKAWGGESVWAIASARLGQPPPDPRTKRSDLPTAAAELVLRCMARKREHRFASAAEVAASLAGLTLPAPAALRTSSPPPHVVIEADAKALAVLPFRNLGPAEDEYLADGLGDDLLDALSMTPGLRVLSRGAVARFRGPDRDAREVGRELRVQVVVDGSLRRAASTLRVSARVVSVADGFQLWARRFDRPEKDALAVSDEVANAVAGALTVTRSAPARVAPNSSRAVDLYLRARHALNHSWRGNTHVTIGLFEQALALAPDDPTMLAGYARAQLVHFMLDTESAGVEETKRACRSAAERAIARAPHAGEARAVLAGLEWMLGDHVGCARALREALRAAPSSSDVNALCGRLLLEAGEPERGIAFLTSAVELDPAIDAANGDIVRGRALLGDWSAHDAAIDEEPPSVAQATPRLFLIARLTAWRRDAALAEVVRRKMDKYDFALKLEVSRLLGLFDGSTSIPEFVAELDAWGRLAGRSKRLPIMLRQIVAEVRAFVGDEERALAAIDEADAIGLIDVTWLDGCPLLAEMRGDPRFRVTRDRIAARAREAVDVLEGRAR